MVSALQSKTNIKHLETTDFDEEHIHQTESIPELLYRRKTEESKDQSSSLKLPLRSSLSRSSNSSKQGKRTSFSSIFKNSN